MNNEQKIQNLLLVVRKNKSFDSAVTTSIYNMWSPLRARKIGKYNLLKPFLPFESFGNIYLLILYSWLQPNPCL